MWRKNELLLFTTVPSNTLHDAAPVEPLILLHKMLAENASLSLLFVPLAKGCRMENKMTNEQRQILNRINAYAEEVMADIDPQKVPVSVQLDKLRPVMEELAGELDMSLEEIFILYMDLQSEASCLSDSKLKEELKNLNEGEGMPLLYR